MKSIKLQMRAQPDPSSKLFWLADTVCSKAAISVKEMGGIPGMWKKDSWVRGKCSEREGGKSRDGQLKSLTHFSATLPSGAFCTSTDERTGGNG